MEKSELVKEFHLDLKKQGLSSKQEDSKLYFESMFNILFDEIASGRTVVITNFGTFSSKLMERKNPKTGESIERFSVNFKPCTKLKEKINEKIIK